MGLEELLKVWIDQRQRIACKIIWQKVINIRICEEFRSVIRPFWQIMRRQTWVRWVTLIPIWGAEVVHLPAISTIRHTLVAVQPSRPCKSSTGIVLTREMWSLLPKNSPYMLKRGGLPKLVAELTDRFSQVLIQQIQDYRPTQWCYSRINSSRMLACREGYEEG